MQKRQLYNEKGPVCMGEGDWSSSHTALTSCCHSEFVARRGPTELMRFRTGTHTYTHTHIYGWEWAQPALRSWATPVWITPSISHFSQQGHPTADEKALAKLRMCSRLSEAEWTESTTRGRVLRDGRVVQKKPSEWMELCDANNTQLASPSDWIDQQSSHC